MKSVRIWYRKEGAAKYMSHLDLVRVMGRVFHRAGIPLWYTEGFNPHPFMTFALPLSLGTVGLRETMDIKLEDEISREAILEKMNPCMPDGITVFDVTDPVMKPGAIAFGQYRIELFCGETTPEALLETVKGQLEKKELIIEKRSKKGVKLFDLSLRFRKRSFFLTSPVWFWKPYCRQEAR
ncbi:MAG: TIGR03936 family radical SAM-associated protein [[Clostridium] leptum]